MTGFYIVKEKPILKYILAYFWHNVHIYGPSCGVLDKRKCNSLSTQISSEINLFYHLVSHSEHYHFYMIQTYVNMLVSHSEHYHFIILQQYK
jgi:hypothetical protein